MDNHSQRLSLDLPQGLNHKILVLAQAVVRGYTSRKKWSNQNFEDIIRSSGQQYIDQQDEKIKFMYDRWTPFKLIGAGERQFGKIHTIHELENNYIGECNELGAYEGLGLMCIKNGGIKGGCWRNGTLNGLCWILQPCGILLVGNYNNGVEDGLFNQYDYKGIHSKVSYQNGDFIKILEINWPNGISYTGDLVENIMEGKGKMVWPNGSFYEGEFKNNLRHGKGKLKYISEKFKKKILFDGLWELGNFIRLDQKGEKIALFEGSHYKAHCKNGIEKVTTVTSANGVSYEGEWNADSKKEGKGVLKCPNGSFYEGEFKNDLIHGEGKMTRVCKNGKIKIIEGLWEFGYYVRFDKSGNKIGITEIEPGLYLGNINDAMNIENLTALGIKHIIQLLNDEKTCPRFPNMNYYFFCLKDEEDEDLLIYIPGVLHIINSKVKIGEPVLVHCRAGISRSCSIIIAYLMRKHEVDYNIAFAMVKEKRSIVFPNRGFQRQLKLSISPKNGMDS